jgi:thioredoxin 1
MSDLIKNISEGEFNSEVELSTGKVLVDFWAPWCGPCRMLVPILEQLAEEMKDQLKIMKVNVDENLSVSTKFGVSVIPTMILFKDGKVVNQMVGMTTKPKIKDFIASGE